MRRYIAKPAARALTATGGFLGRFSHSLNPYVGCAFGDAGGCPFCYVRALPVAHSESGSWGSWVIAKSNLPELLGNELERFSRSGTLDRLAIFMSSATDPYQGWERQMRLTRGALEMFVRHPPRRLLIQTRSPIIERDIELLSALGSRVIASITLETDNDEVRKSITPTSPSVERRLEVAGALRSAGIFVQLAIAPMMPNDPERFAALALEVADRVVIDTFFAGDGASGRRSKALGIGQLYRTLGHGAWFEPGAEKHLMRAMARRFGACRVLFSAAGFSAI